MFSSCKKNLEIKNIDSKGGLKNYVLSEVTQDTIFIDTLIDRQTIKFTPLQTTAESLLGAVDKVFKSDSSYVIYDRQLNKILSFDSNGSFLSQTGREGKGPNEYVGRLCFNFNKYSNTVDVIDDRYKMIKYEPLTDTVIQEKDLKFDDFAVDDFYPTGKDAYLLYNNLSMELKDDTFYRFAYMKDNRFIYKALPYANNADLVRAISSNRFYTFEGQIYFHETFNSKNTLVYRVNESGLEPDYRIYYESIEDTYKDTSCCLSSILKGEELGHVIRLDDILESGRFLFLYYGESYDAGSGTNGIFFSRFAIYDKFNKTCVKNSALSFMLEELYLNIYLRQLADDTFVSFIPAYIIVNRQELITKFINPEDYTELMKEFMKIDVEETDNPVVISMKMKDL